MSEPQKFQNYREFFPYYVKAHSDLSNRVMHMIGTLLGMVVLVVALVTGHPWYAVLWPVIAYAFAWTGHFLLEKNTPATFGHPLWSLRGDYHMLALMITGRLGPYLEQKQNDQ